LGHLIASYFSFGYNHPDEHYQILEFAAHFTGLNPDSSSLPWEYQAQIRPWLQPFLHAIPMKALSILGLYQPFDLAAFFRVFYSALNLASLWAIWTSFKKKFNLDPRWFLLIGTLWFFPYLHVRNSSENLSCIFLTFAFAAFMSEKGLLRVGILFGLAFLARYQVALGLLGLGIGLVIRDRRITFPRLKLLRGFTLVVGFGALLDRIGYGNWVLTPYRYFKVNLIDGVAARFNPYPWYQYFIWIVQLNPVVSLPLFFGVFLYAKKQKMDPLSWFVISFFGLHLFITNKEYRFLFPILHLAVLMSIVAYQGTRERWFKKPYLLAYGASSALAFFASTTHGASLETLWCIHMADRYGIKGETWLSNRDFLTQFHSTYYRLDRIQIELYRTPAELEPLLARFGSVKVIVDAKYGEENTQAILKLLETKGCQIITSSQPLFIFGFREQLPILDRMAYRALYTCANWPL